MTAVQHTPSPNPVPAKVPGLRTASLPPGWSPGWSARRCPTVIPAARRRAWLERTSPAMD